MMEKMTSKGKGVVIKEIENHDVVGNEFDSEIGNSEVDQENDVEWQDDPYHLVDEPGETKEITDIFVELDQAIDELDQVVATEMVAEEAVDGEHVVSDRELVAQEGVGPFDDGDVISNEVVAEEMLEDQTRSITRRRVMADKFNEDDAQ
nr:hypothetical protein [Tanacetum cinerariifolium]